MIKVRLGIEIAQINTAFLDMLMGFESCNGYLILEGKSRQMIFIMTSANDDGIS